MANLQKKFQTICDNLSQELSPLLDFLASNQDTNAKLFCQELNSLGKDHSLSMEQIALKHVDFKYQLSDTTEEAEALKSAKLCLITYLHINQIYHLLRQVVGDAQSVNESLEYWKSRPSYWFYLEKTPLFWWDYLKERVSHPIKEQSLNIEILQSQDSAGMTLLGKVFYLLAKPLGPDLLQSNTELLNACQSFFNIPLSKDLTIPELYEQIRSMLGRIENYQIEVRDTWQKAQVPPFLSRNWLKILIICFSSYIILKQTNANKEFITETIINVKDAVINFFQFQVWGSIRKIYNIIRYEPSEEEAIMRLAGAKESETSLVRMVRDFNIDTRPDLTLQELEAIELQARHGNLASVMPPYEHEMIHPIKGAFFGDFIRLILIQVQKQKVDVEKSLLQIDKLLQSNELNFQIMAMFPVAVICYFSYRVLTREKNHDHITRKAQALAREIHVLLNKSSNQDILVDYEYGKLLVNLFRFSNLAKDLGSSRRWIEEDIIEIETEHYTNQQRLNTLNRMYLTYNFLKPSTTLW